MHEFLTWVKDWLGLLGPIFAGIGITWKYFLKQKWEEFKVAHENLKKLVIFIPTIERIDYELKPNGGSSVKDAINRIESKINLQDQKVLALIKSMPYGTFISDSDGNWTDVNLTLCRITGRTESELEGRDWLNWIDEKHKLGVILEWERAIKNKMVFDVEVNYSNPNGEYIPLRFSGNQLKNEKDELVGYFGTVYEIVN